MKQLKEFIIGRIFTLNEQRNRSTNQLAGEADLTQSTLSNIISGRSIPNIKTIDSLCKAYGISISRFFQGYNSRNTDIVVENEDMHIINFYRDLPQHEKDVFLKVMREFVNAIEQNSENNN